MKGYRPLLIENLGLSLPGLEVLRLRLNEHLPRSEPRPHAHGHAQMLIYLRGQGAQTVGGERYLAKAGSVIYVEPGARHEFRRERRRRPLCLVMDLRVANPFTERTMIQLPAAELSLVRRRVSDLLGGGGRAVPDRDLTAGAAILDVLAAVVRAASPSRRMAPRRASVTWRAERALKADIATGDHSPLAAVCRRLGYQRDHLNRLLKGECGLTLGQLRARIRLDLAQRSLREGRSVGEAGSAVGIDDQNYFARWFKAQTGTSPSRWRSG